MFVYPDFTFVRFVLWQAVLTFGDLRLDPPATFGDLILDEYA